MDGGQKTKAKDKGEATPLSNVLCTLSSNLSNLSNLP